jgi:hypothetical protein
MPDSIGVRIKTNQRTLRLQSLQNRFCMPSAAERAVNKNPVS